MDNKELKNNPFTVPPDYFGQLHEVLLARVAEERLKEQVPADGLTVPSGYFEKLHDRILAGTTNVTESIPVVLLKGRSPRRWISYAAAACVTIAIGAVALWQSPQRGVNFEQHVAAVSDTEIISYLQYYSETGDGNDLADEINVEPGSFNEQFSADELENYLEQTL